ncbi:MFS transporter [Acinetobacter sp. NIPH 2699]|uniref:MFS transporter n=1 Tax=Acinetobacter sp. NIPH 2699 TaxID=2923433 RepID=UPI001F4B5ECC|nr:MFS transporter [Acinetobacter sp. NIPH 2699]MCH7335002.1 MFS transporter [Acinetobacter sp. NIPH 2699]
MQQNFKLLAWATLANGTCFSMILPLLAPLIRQLQLTEIQGGIIVSAGAICMAIASVFIAKNQKIQTPYQLMSYGFWGMTITWAIFTLILYFGIHQTLPVLIIFILLVISRAMTGAFMAMPQIGLQSYVMQQVIGTEQRSQKMAMYGAMNSLGMILGPFATSVLLLGGILLPMWVAVALLIIFSIVLSFSFRKTPVISAENIQLDSNTSVKTFSIKPALPWLILGFSTYVAIVTLNMTAGFYIQDRFQLTTQQSASYFSQCMLIVGFSLVITQILIMKVIKLKLQILVGLGIMCMITGLLLSLFTSQIHIFQASYVFYGMGVASLLPAFTTGAAQSVNQDAQVKMASMCTAIQALGLIVAPLLSTFLYQYGIALPFYLLLILMIIVGLYFIGITILRERNAYLSHS